MSLAVFVMPDLRTQVALAPTGLPQLETILTLSGAEAHHASTVKRINSGELIEVVDGNGLRVQVEIQTVTKTQVTGVIRQVKEDPKNTLRITLVQALAKNGRDEQAAETATEFGVDAVIPWEAQRSIVNWSKGQKVAKGISKWEQVVLAAAKQSRRAHIPQVEKLVNSGQLRELIAEQVAQGVVVLVCHEQEQRPLVDYLAHTFQEFAQQPNELWLIVGPEGGITDVELAEFQAAGAVPVLLGAHILRSATAGPWAIAVLRAVNNYRVVEK